MKKIVYTLFALMLLVACKDTTDDGPIVNEDAGQDPIEGVRLVFPFEDTLCNEGINPTPTESTVFFEWDPNNNAQVYTLTIENLASGNTVQYETEDFIFPVTIERAVAFRWFVTYNFQGETKESAVWNFYNAGPGIQSYPPFSAELIAPSMAQIIPTTTSVVLEWVGSDVDGDIVSYDLHFGTDNPPELVTTDITATQIAVTVVPGTIYYWQIVTKDAEGNSSESGVFQFRVLD
ncbi:hypothetical protein [Winogradskyella sp.]|uniref:hypothetical protein n=1 Tax=Winogradskyella sp. TaxID=1883156 RepID=UPI003BAD8E61